MKVIGLDLGDKGKLFACYSDGVVVNAPKYAAKTAVGTINYLLSHCDILITESSTIGSCGIEPQEVRYVLANHPGKQILLCSTRLLKNMRKSAAARGEPLPEKGDDADAKLIATLYDEKRSSLKTWKYVPPEERYIRKHRSVRPHDKREYKGDECDRWMHLVRGYRHSDIEVKITRSLAMPFAMAMEEKLSTSREGYEKVIGLYAHGYPSFYRRATISLMRRIALQRSGKKKIAETTPQERKEAMKLTRRWIRGLYQHMKDRQKIPHTQEKQGVFAFAGIAG